MDDGEPYVGKITQKAILFGPEGDVLLTRVGDHWEPPGGTFEFGETLVEASADLVTIVDSDGEIPYANSAVETAFEEGEALFEWTHQRADGTTFPAEVKLSRFELEEVRSAYPDAVITRESDVPPSTVRVNDMLGSVFRNLLKNAVQHNHRAVPKVAVSASTSDDTVVVRIADNGPGIPDEQKDTIFAKGEKGLDSSGTGIGLYLVETLVENHGGDVRVEDRAAQEPPAGPTSSDDEPTGAAFVVELPTAGSSTDR